MRVAVFDTHRYDQEALEAANVDHGHELVFFEPRLNSSTAVLASGFRAVCSFVNDRVDAETLGMLRQGGTDIVALRSAGYNHVDVGAAAVGMCLLLQAAAVYVALLQKVLHTVPPTLSDWGVIAACSLLPVALVEFVKVIQRVATRNPPRPHA